MSASVAKDVKFKIGTHAVPGTVTDRSTYFKSINFPRAAEEKDVTAFGNNGNKTFLPGLKDATFSAEGWYDATIGAHLDAVYDFQDIVDFEYGPINGANGAPKYEGVMFVTNWEIGDDVGEGIPFTVTFRISDAVALGTYSA